MNLIGYGHFGKCIVNGFDNQIKVLKKGEKPQSEVVFITVRPQDMDCVLSLLEDYEGLIITFAAGLPLSYYEAVLPNKRVIRAMSNIGVYFGCGVTGWIMGRNCTAQDYLIAENSFSRLGTSIRLYEESHLDTITALTGSGIAYISEICHIFQQCGIEQGMTEGMAEMIVLETLKSVIAVHEKSNLTLEEIVKSVSSRGGTTEAGLQTMKDGGVSEAIKKGLENTILKCQNLCNRYSERLESEELE